MTEKNQKDKAVKSEVIVLDNLKTSNLPELIGWKEKQEKLVNDNPYVEIIDTKTYNEACKSRTNLLKGRTELQNQDKAVASKLASFRKEVGTETGILIDITKPHEEKQDTEVKRWEDIKTKEKEEKANAEANRIKAIQDKLESIETEAYKVIQPMEFSEIESKSESVRAILSADGFDFEEYDVMWDQVVSRVESSLESKVKTLTANEEQRLDNLRLEKENAESKRISDLQSKRLTEIMPYVAFGVALDFTKLGEMDDTEYSGHLESKKGLFESDAEIKKKAEEERLAKEEEEKDAVYEIRKKRLEESGMKYSDEHDTFWTDANKEYIILKEDIYNEDALEFENTLVEAKGVIAEAIANKVKLKIQSRIEVLKELMFVNFVDAEYTWQLSDKIFVNESILATRDDDWFKEFVQDSKDHLQKLADEQKKADKKASEEEAKRMKAENKARIKQYAKDKKTLTEFVGSLDFRNAVPELENSDLDVVVSEFLEVVEKWKSEAIELISKY